MPRFREASGEVAVAATVFDQVNAIIARVAPSDLVRLDMGDTCLKPPFLGQPLGLDQSRFPSYHLYTATSGIPELKALLVSKLREKNALKQVTDAHVQLTCGAIHGLFSTFKSLLEPGEEVLVLSPRWPLISGVVKQAGGTPVDLPFYIPLLEDPSLSIRALLESGLSKRTAVIYLNSPNNPSGSVLTREQLEEILAFAEEHGLWIVSDEAYEDFIYSESKHISAASLPGASRRVISVFTFSKCLASAGYRVGYVVGDPDLISKINTISAQTVYNAPSDNQQLAAQAMETWEAWFPPIKQFYQEQLECFASHFKGPYQHPQAGFYAFVDIRPHLDRFRPAGGTDSQAALAVLEALIASGVALLPGEAFAVEFTGWLRACFIAEPADRLIQGVERMNRVLAPSSSSLRD
jgi:N-succinyldiaminopimelate aminotransferase